MNSNSNPIDDREDLNVPKEPAESQIDKHTFNGLESLGNFLFKILILNAYFKCLLI